MNLIRQLLLLVEDQGNDMNSWIEDTIVEGYTKDQINQHVWLLKDGGYIEAIDLSDFDGSDYRPRCLTWQGHEFLDSVREKDIWEKTLEIARKGGAGTLAAFRDIAIAVAKKRVEKLLDIA